MTEREILTIIIDTRSEIEVLSEQACLEIPRAIKNQYIEDIDKLSTKLTIFESYLFCKEPPIIELSSVDIIVYRDFMATDLFKINTHLLEHGNMAIKVVGDIINEEFIRKVKTVIKTAFDYPIIIDDSKSVVGVFTLTLA